ncbi:carbohydrate ABC transporter permease [Lysobacter korlensis]|uniref:Carbohydrate ABC transporter permease n=1 Tax=Lysobacter korlensis TaxID=553636 RepID=A0ABV6RX51_9GAMM
MSINVEIPVPSKGTGPAEPPTGAGLARSRGPRRRPVLSYGSWWWALPSLTFVFLIHYLATIFGGFYAFTDYSGIGGFNWIGVENFVRIFQDPAMVGALRNTLVMAFVFLVVTNVLGILFALALNRLLKTRYLLRVLIFAPVVLSSLAVSYIFKFIFQFNGPLNGFFGFLGLTDWQKTWLADPTFAIVAILVVLIWQNVGLTMVIYLAGLASVPVELEEAAALDGAGVWNRFRNVVLPSIQPSVAIATTLTLISGLRVFDQVMAMTGGGPFGATDTLATVIYRETFAFGRFGYGSALALTLSLFVVIAAVGQLYLTRDRNRKA